MDKLTFLTSCVEADGDDINAMKDTGVPVSYRTFRQHCAGVNEWAAGVGYARASNAGSGVTLKGDWHVGYYRGVYRGAPRYYLTWSGIEHIWTRKS